MPRASDGPGGADDDEAPDAPAVVTAGVLGGMCCLAAVGPPLLGLVLGLLVFGALWLFDVDLGPRRERRWALLATGVAVCLVWMGASHVWRRRRR